MKLDGEILDFLASPVLLIVCAADRERRPAIGRGIGLLVEGPDELDLVLSRWQWPDLVRNIETSGRLALTACRASDYVCFQFKGTARVREAGATELECASAYWSAIDRSLRQEKVPPSIAAQWTPDRELVAARLRIIESYIQTPGPLAGASL
jgi:hypothetical protein